MSARRWARDSTGLLIAVVAAAVLVVVPLVKLAQITFSSGWQSVTDVVGEPGMGTAALHSLLLAIAVSLVAVPAGTALALFLRRPEVPARRALKLAVLGPLIVPQFVLGYSWTQAYGRAGFSDQLLGVWWPGLTGPAGIVVVLVVDTVPLCYLLSSVGLATRAAPELERAAHASGATGWATLRTVTLPLLRPVLAAEALLAFIATLEAFAVPEVLGAPSGFSTLTVRIYSDLTLGSDPRRFADAVTGSLGLVVVAAAIVVPADIVLGPRLRSLRPAHSSGGVGATARTRWAAVGTLLIGGGVAFGVLVPLTATLTAAVTRAVGVSPTPSNWTLANFRTALDGPTVQAMGNSLQLAAASATLLTALGALVAALERRRAGRALGAFAVLTLTIPGTALAVGLLIAYGRWFGGSLALILLAYLAKFWALAHRTVSGAVDRVPPAEWQAARASGAGPAVAARTIWLPALAPALLGAWALVFLGALHEVTMSSLLYSFGNETIAVAVLNQQQLGGVGVTAALSVVLTALIVLAAIPGALALRLRSHEVTHAR